MRLAIAIPMMAACGAASAQSTRCRVMDPTGTPLNLRETPGGRIVGRLSNDVLVERAETVIDASGRAWTRILSPNDGRHLGYVFREFIACF